MARMTPRSLTGAPGSMALSSTETEKAARHALGGAEVARTKEDSHRAFTHPGQGENYTWYI